MLSYGNALDRREKEGECKNDETTEGFKRALDGEANEE